MSADGHQIAFASAASNLVPGDHVQCPGTGIPTKSCYDIFVRDVFTGVTQMVSLSSSGLQANRDSRNPVISGDGTKVAFVSSATNLATRCHCGGVYVRDLAARTTTLVRDGGDYPSLSNDGRYVAFEALLHGHPETYVRDLKRGGTTLVSTSSSGQVGNGSTSFPPKISSNGRYVVFTSDASNLTPGDNNGHADVFVRDLQQHTTELVSIPPTPTATDPTPKTFVGVNTRGDDSISGDGNLVSFAATENGAKRQYQPAEGYYIRNRALAKTTFVAYWLTDDIGSANDSPGPYDELSPDGERFTFLSQEALGSGSAQVWGMTTFVYTIADGSFRRASSSFTFASWPGVSGTGGRVVFGAVPPNCTLKYGDCWSIYYYSLVSGKTTPVVVIG